MADRYAPWSVFIVNILSCFSYVSSCFFFLFCFKTLGVALVLCQSDPVLNDGQSGSGPSREDVIEGVRKRFIEKVVTEHEEEDDGSSSD